MNNQRNYINFPIWKSNLLIKLRKINKVVYNVTKDYIRTNGISKKMQHDLIMVRIKLIRSYYLYLNRTILYAYTYHKEFQNFIKSGYVTTERLISQLNTTENPYFTYEEKKYFKLTQKTLEKYGVVDKNTSLYSYGIFIQLVLKRTFCKDIANYICDFI